MAIMKNLFVLSIWILLLLSVLSSPGELCGQQKKPSPAEKLFALKVQPIFQNKCFGCHGEKDDELEGGFDLRTRESFLKGGDSFEAELLTPGDSSQGHFLAIVSRQEEGYEMPPKEADRLSEEEVWAIRDWIDGGAPWPNKEKVAQIYKDYAEGTAWKTSGGLSQEWTDRKYKQTDLWAYQPLWTDTKNVLDDQQSTIDYFIDQKLQSAKIGPAQLADRPTLIRRATYDLLGLPPTRKQIEQFVQDPRNDHLAFEALIDKLLSSKHYGEQWGRHWLDVVRYADSSGFANDWERPNAWRYRDYVIRAFNSDKPYDEFVREQLAGDELAAKLANPNPNTNDRASELHIAAGFLRMGPWEHTGMSVARVTRQQFLDDITDSVGQVFLAHALQCCKCHDHKFDPVPTRDYYSIQAVFATTQFAEVDAKWLPSENLNNIEENWKYKDQKIAATRKLSQAIQNRNAQYIEKWFRSKNLPYKTVAEARKAKVPKEQMPPRRYGWTPNDYGQDRVVRKWEKRHPWEKDQYRPIAYTVYNGKTLVKNSNQGRLHKPANPLKQGYWQPTTILNGGDVGSPGEKVTPGILSAAQLDQEFPDSYTGRRLAFAEWLTSGKNPLVARVIVNRIWQYHFGRGIAGNSNNFGATGKPPTHPKLLDWLAKDFMDNGWSIKKLHKKIMLTAAYRRSSQHDQFADLRAKDPENKYYAVFEQRQLAAEEIRDSMLAVTGELNRQLGGIPNRPDMNLEAALQPRMIMGTFAPSYVPNPKPEQRNRRSIYALKLRGQRDPFMELFNQPGPDKSCELRDRSMVTPQALTLLNGEETNDRALALAIRATRETDSQLAALSRVFELAYGRQPSPNEKEAAMSAWEKLTAIEKEIKYSAKSYPTEIKRTANEENTGQLFTFVEELIEYKDYVPDTQPHQVDASTRGLANLCLAIFNSNEFMFVD